VNTRSLCAILAKEYNIAPPTRLRPVDTLVLTILSQNTSDTNSWRAFQSLRRKFPSWERVADAPVRAVERAISCGGLAKAKSHSIKRALNTLRERNGSITLAPLAKMGEHEAKRWLTSIKGVGPKTASVVLLFAFGKSALPVDTHVYRVSRRLGLVPLDASRERAQHLLERVVPPSCYYAFHVGLIQHGRMVCVARKPRCSRCPLEKSCPRVGVTASA
jgi:endonuclease-3